MNNLKECQTCSKKFTPTPGNANHYCSRICYWKSLKNKQKPLGVMERLAMFNRGKKRSAEVCQHISQGCLGRKLKPHQIEAIRKANTGRPKSVNWYKAMKRLRRNGNPRWKGGRFTRSTDGYVFILKRRHPHANTQGYIMEHRWVMEQRIGRHLLPEEIVHHINHIRNDNRIENLQLFSSNSEHATFHHSEK